MQPTFVSRETSLTERERSRNDRETLLGERDGERERERERESESERKRVNTECWRQNEGAKRWDWPVLLWPSCGTPIARMRAKVKLRQVVTFRRPLSFPRHGTSFAHPCRRTVLLLFLPPCRAYSASSRSRPSRARRFAVMGAAGDRDRPIGCEARRSCGRGVG